MSEVQYRTYLKNNPELNPGKGITRAEFARYLELRPNGPEKGDIVKVAETLKAGRNSENVDALREASKRLNQTIVSAQEALPAPPARPVEPPKVQEALDAAAPGHNGQPAVGHPDPLAGLPALKRRIIEGHIKNNRFEEALDTFESYAKPLRLRGGPEQKKDLGLMETALRKKIDEAKAGTPTNP
jgi:hypothetical protein